MKLELFDLEKIATGVDRIEQEKDGCRFHRFTKEQEKYYSYNYDFSQKALATSCVTLHFKTDSSYLAVDMTVESRSSRSYFTFDLLINGVLTDSLTNLSKPLSSPIEIYPLGRFTKKFDLGEGTKDVRLVFPFSCDCVMHSIELQDGVVLLPVKAEKRMLSFGDSITHGYDTVHPINNYAYALAESLNADVINKGIGAETFCPDLLCCAEKIAPDFITVAYGTNDWVLKTANDLKSDSNEFFKRLTGIYPTAKIFAILPIWRGEEEDYHNDTMTFTQARNIIGKTATSNDIMVIDAIDFVPHFLNNYTDRLHPNDNGHRYYAKGLINKINELF